MNKETICFYLAKLFLKKTPQKLTTMGLNQHQMASQAPDISQLHFS